MPIEEQARAAGLSVTDVGAAATLYRVKCAKCHKFYDPAGYSDGEWQSWKTKMSKKARLKPDQEQLLARFLGTARLPPARGGKSSEPEP